MAENPLLPDAELRALQALLKGAAKAESAANRRAAKASTRRTLAQPGREALLAGALAQLRPGDVFVAEPGDAVPATLLPTDIELPVHAPDLPEGVPQLMISAALAAALPATDPKRLVLALLRSSLDEPGWDRALAWAQCRRLPLILACTDPSGAMALLPARKPKPGAMDWSAISRAAGRLKLPILTVDGEDAVAVYRVVQESILRARSGDGPAVLWAVLPSPSAFDAERPASASPLRRLERYLRARKIAL